MHLIPELRKSAEWPCQSFTFTDMLKAVTLIVHLVPPANHKRGNRKVCQENCIIKLNNSTLYPVLPISKTVYVKVMGKEGKANLRVPYFLSSFLLFCCLRKLILCYYFMIHFMQFKMRSPNKVTLSVVLCQFLC